MSGPESGEKRGLRLSMDMERLTFRSGSQNARVLTEHWASEQMFCPNCGHGTLEQLKAGLPVADFRCAICADQYELKSQKTAFGKKLANGAYATKIARLASDTSPNLILMHYDLSRGVVRDLSVIPKRFFVASIIEKRPALRPPARRAGRIGSNILIGRIPEIGRIAVVRDGSARTKSDVIAEWRRTAFLDRESGETRGWLVDVMICVESLKSEVFTLAEIYGFEDRLQELYPGNRNVRPKIRQQLQVLRDNGYLEFLGDGRYRKLH